MLIGLCGGICAGKHAVANYLVKYHSFTKLGLCVKLEYGPQKSLSNGSHGDMEELKTIDSSEPDYSFTSTVELLEFVTSKWRQHWVTTDIDNQACLDSIIRRPFFLLVSIDAPIRVRWNRSRARSSGRGEKLLSLEEFAEMDDDYIFNPDRGLTNCLDRADIRIINATASISELHGTLEKVNLLDEQRLRPSWDQYFMQLASLAAHRSNCMKRRVGCVLVREKRVISTGYNGTPRNLRNCNEGGCARCNQGLGSGIGLSTCLCLHAEENALLEAGRERIREGSILYCDTCPCLTCSIKIAQVGISEVVYSQSYSMDQKTASVLNEAGVKLRQLSSPQTGIV